MIVIGLGSGRTGTASLSFLIGSQKDAVCFHEVNPSGAVFEGNPQSILNTTNEFLALLGGGDRRLLAIDYSRPASVKTYGLLQKMERVRIIGDIAYYYLRYVEDILAVTQDVRFVCIKRDKTKTVDSWMEKSAVPRWRSLKLADRLKSVITRTPYHESRNFWQVHDGTVYQHDPVWDKTFPKFEAQSKREAIEKYWDYYYREADVLARKHPEHFRIFDIGLMSNPDGQREILRFIGIPDAEMIVKERFHVHKRGGD